MSKKEAPVLVVLGDGGVGKTSIVLRFIRDQFSQTYEPTLEDNYKTKVLLDNGSTLDIDIADTAGQDDYISLRDRYMDIADAFLVVYSITDNRSLTTAESLLQQISTLRENKPFKFLLAGNKCDLAANRKVTQEDGKSLADKYHGRFLETSAFKRLNIDEAFKDLARMLVQTEATDVGCNCRIA